MVLLDLCFTPQCFSPSRGQASVCRQSDERSRQPNVLAEETGLQSPCKKGLHETESAVNLYCFFNIRPSH